MGVYKEGKNWKVQVYYKDWQGNRKRKQKRGFRTKGEAKEWERDFLQQQSQGVDIEFGNFLEIYYKDMDVRLREHTMYTKRYIIDLKIRPYFEKKILSEITVADVRAWQNELLTYKDKNGKGYSQTYLKTINCQLTAIFNYAIRYYNLQDNPCRKAGAIGKSKGEPKNFWMQDEFNEFLETVNDKPEARMAFLLLYWTGMRIGELLALTYDDINLDEKTISITKSYQRLKGKDVITQPKTPKSIRVITMPDFLAEEFREYCSHLYGIMKNERLFHFTKSHMEHCMAAGIEKSGVKRIRLHDLRHSHASMLVDMGVAPLEIAERLGHEKVETTLNTYSHLYPSTQSKLAGLLDKRHEAKAEGSAKMVKKNNVGSEKWTYAEFEKFLQTFPDGSMEKLAFEMLYWTGMRAGELIGLFLKDFDLDKGIVSINKSAYVENGRTFFTGTKTISSNRAIDIPQFLVNDIENYLNILKCKNPEIQIFDTSVVKLSYLLQRHAECANIKKIRVHMFRKMHRDMLIEIEVPAVEREERLGKSVFLPYMEMGYKKTHECVRLLEEKYLSEKGH